MRFLCFVPHVLMGLIALTSCLPEPPSANQGWGQQQQAAPSGWGQAPAQQSGGWGQQQQQQQSGWGQPQQQQSQGWGQQSEAQSSGGWGQPQQQEMTGWGQPMQETQGGWGQSGSGEKGQKGKGVSWGFNFALGHQGAADGNKGGGGGKGSGGGGGAGVGWSSMPETNIKKPSIGEIFRTIIGIPREIKNFLKESGLWILFLPLIVILPLIYVAYSAGRFFGGLNHGWGWDKRSQARMNEEWNNIMGFLKDPKVHKAAKGFMDEFVAKRIIKSVEEPVVSKKSS